MNKQEPTAAEIKEISQLLRELKYCSENHLECVSTAKVAEYLRDAVQYAKNVEQLMRRFQSGEKLDYRKELGAIKSPILTHGRDLTREQRNYLCSLKGGEWEIYSKAHNMFIRYNSENYEDRERMLGSHGSHGSHERST